MLYTWWHFQALLWVLQRCCFRCRWPSSLHSFHWGRSGRAGSRSVYPSPCRAARLQRDAFLGGHTHFLLITEKFWRSVTFYFNMTIVSYCGAVSYLQTGCRPVWCHTELWPAARRGLAPGTAAGTCNSNADHHIHINCFSHLNHLAEAARLCSWLKFTSVL